MSQLNGKQIKDISIDLEKLSGTGSVSFSSGANVVFTAGSTLERQTVDITSNTDVVNKEYVDSVVQGLEIKDSARVIATSSITLSGTQTVDGITLTQGDRIVVNGQPSSVDNGIYVVNTSGAWSRSEDMDEPSEVNGGEFVFITEGNLYADTGWVVSSPDQEMASIGSANIIFTQFSSAGVIQAGDGLTKVGNTLDINDGIGLEIDGSNNIRISDTGVVANLYGSAGSVATFSVNSQGQITSATTVLIDIPSTQINDFSTATHDEIFDATNFTDSASIDFNVTAGATLSAYVKADDTRALGVDGSGVYVKIDNDTIVYDAGEIKVDPTSFGVQGSDNGISIDSSSNVILGGTLSQDTTINGVGSYSLVFDNNLNFTVNSDNQIQLQTLTGEIDLTSDTLDVNNTRSDINSTTSIIANSPDIDFIATTFDVSSDSIVLSSNDFNVFVTNSIVATSSSLLINANDIVFTDTDAGTKEGIKYANTGNPSDYVTNDYSLTTKGYVDTGTNSIWLAINDINTTDIDEITAGSGLVGGGTQGVVDIAIGDGAGIKVNADNIDVEITAQGGLTFSQSGNLGTLEVEVDGTTIQIVDGALSVIAGSAQPVYEVTSPTSAIGSNNNGDSTGFSLTKSPNDYSRIEVYINGQRQLLGDGDTTKDCWFGTANSSTLLSNVTVGSELYWNSESAGFSLESSDRLEVIYES